MERLFLLLIIVLSFFSLNKKRVLLIAFLLGLFLDLIAGTHLGRTSLSLLITSFLSILYTFKYSSRHFIFQIIFTLIAIWLFYFLQGKNLIWQKDGFFILLVLTIVYFVSRRFQSRKLELEI